MGTYTLAVVLARAGSKGLPHKNVLPLAGRPMITYTIEDALGASEIDAVCVTTDSAPAAAVARSLGVVVVDRPPELATDTAPVDAAVRHAVECYEAGDCGVTHVAILYANVPVRADGIIDQTVRHLIDTGADSTRTLTLVTKQHPDWLHRLEGDRMAPFRTNSIDRRQDLEPLYYHDGAVLAVTRASLFTAGRGGPHAFLGSDRRGLVQQDALTIDVDSPSDFRLAEAVILARQQAALSPKAAPADAGFLPAHSPLH